MNQKKIGEFIAAKRKAKNITQKNLAEQLNITDKAVSKWECGKSLPDHSLLQPLCDILEISINELLCGEQISSEDYHKKAEENMVNLVENASTVNKKAKQQTVKLLFITIILFILFLIILNPTGGTPLYLFFDIKSLSLDILLIIIMQLSAGKWIPVKKLFVPKQVQSEEDIRQIKCALTFAIKSSMLSGTIITLIGFVLLLQNWSEYSVYGIASSLLALLYSSIITGVILIMRETQQS